MTNSKKSGFHKRRHPPKQPRMTISISSELLPDGRYGMVLTAGETVRWMNRTDTLAHCAAAMQVAMRAEHDAGIFRQLTPGRPPGKRESGVARDTSRQTLVDDGGKATMDAILRSLEGLDASEQDLRMIGEVLKLVRGRYTAVDRQALHPLYLEPSVTLTGEPFIAVHLNGERVGQWTPVDARRHALGCLEVAEAVELDNHYRDTLTADLSCSEQTASALVGMLAREMASYTVVES